MNQTVSVTECADYSPAAVQNAMRAVLEPIGGLDFVKPGMTVVIKANLVTGLKPETAATTHPALLCALTEMLVNRGARVIVGDSPGGLYNKSYLNLVYERTGMQAVKAAGAELNQNFATRIAEYTEAYTARRFAYTAYLDEADAVIDFCKLKTHGMMGMSAAVKNMFGVVPGAYKPEYHYIYSDPNDFADMLLDLNRFVGTRLCIADAVVGMEGNGPTMGRPRVIGALLASQSSYALDLICAELIGLNTAGVPTLRRALQHGLAPETAADIPVIGDRKRFIVPDFDLCGTVPVVFGGEGRSFPSRAAGRILRYAMSSKPGLCSDSCIGCGRCGEICPCKAIILRGEQPRIDRSKCIRCFCCQEFCPTGAMRVKQPWIARMLNR